MPRDTVVLRGSERLDGVKERYLTSSRYSSLNGGDEFLAQHQKL